MIEIRFPTDDVSIAIEWYLSRVNYPKTLLFSVTNRGFYGNGWSFIKIDDYKWKFFGKRGDARLALKAIIEAQKELIKTFKNNTGEDFEASLELYRDWEKTDDSEKLKKKKKKKKINSLDL